MTPQIETAPREQNQKAAFRSKGKLTAGAAFVVALIAIGAVPRILRHQRALAAVNESPVTHPVVTTVRPRTGEASSALLLPGNIQPLYSANVFARTEGYVVTVENNRKVRFVPVAIGRDMGTTVEILNGIRGSDVLVASPSDLLHDGQDVEVRGL
jgi:hypothetical protein